MQRFLSILIDDVSLPKKVSILADLDSMMMVKLTIDTAGTTLSRFGVSPLKRPRTPSYLMVCLVTSMMPVYVLG